MTHELAACSTPPLRIAVGKMLTDVAEASVYGTLRRLFSMGLLTSYVVPSEEGPHRKYYGISPTGHEWLREQKSQWIEFRDVINTISETKNKGDK